MSEALNVTRAAFGGLREVTTAPLWQYDYGQILQITGLDLPQAFEVHFSNSRKSGETITQIGTDNQVVIPDMYLTSGADIYAFIFLHDDVDDGETEYVIKIPVRERPEPSDIEPTPEQQDAITEAIAALNVAVTQTGEDKAATAALAEAAAASSLIATEAAQSAQASATSASALASTASTAASTATTKASEAATSATSAASAKTAAETAETKAQAAQSASESAQASAESAAQTATTKASEAAASAASVEEAAQTATAKAAEASASATSAGGSATAAATSASTATTKASEASASATAAQTAQTAAEAAQAAAETAAATFETDTTLTVSGKAADAKAVGDHIDTLKSVTPKISTPEETDADLYICDSDGNVLAKFEDGGIQTKNFDSAESPKTLTPEETAADLYICDAQGNVIAKFEDGHIVTKNFNSTSIISTAPTDSPADFDVSDVNGNVLARFKDGNFYTKGFNSTFIRNLTNKKWACLGDSLTEHNIRTTLNYHDYIAQETGINVYNLGHSGNGYAKRGGNGQNFVNQADNIPNDVSVITVFGSGNDGSAGLDIGTPTDSGTTTLCGYMNATFDKIYEEHPTTPLGVITPTPWSNQEPSDSSKWMENYSNALIDICTLRGIPCLDLYHCSNLHPTDVNFRPLAYSKDDGDGVHPDETGHALIAPRIRQFLFSLI